MIRQDVVGPGSSLIASVEISLAFHTWNRFRSADLFWKTFQTADISWETFQTADISHVFSRAFEGLTPPEVWEMAGFDTSKALADLAQLPSVACTTLDTCTDAVRRQVAIKTYKYFLEVFLKAIDTPATLTKKLYAALLKTSGLDLPGNFLAARDAVPKSSKRLNHLRHILLLLKIASLLSSVNQPCHSAELAIHMLSGYLLITIHHDLKGSQTRTKIEDELEEKTALLLAEMTVPIIRQRLTASLDLPHTGDCCLQLLVCLLPDMKASSQVGPLLVKQGELSPSRLYSHVIIPPCYICIANAFTCLVHDYHDYRELHWTLSILVTDYLYLGMYARPSSQGHPDNFCCIYLNQQIKITALNVSKQVTWQLRT